MCDQCRKAAKSITTDQWSDILLQGLALSFAQPPIDILVASMTHVLGVEIAREVMAGTLRKAAELVEKNTGHRTSQDTRKVDAALDEIVKKATGKGKGKERGK